MARRSNTATRYAEAVFQVAREQRSQDPWLRELGEVERLLADGLAAKVMISPSVSEESKAKILSEAVPDLSDPVRRFLDLLLHRDRLELLPQVLEGFRQLVNRQRGLETARVTTAVPLEQRERELIAARLSTRTGRRVQIEESVDPRLVGGVIAQIGDQIIDDSIRGRLERMRRALSSN